MLSQVVIGSVRGSKVTECFRFGGAWLLDSPCCRAARETRTLLPDVIQCTTVPKRKAAACVGRNAFDGPATAITSTGASTVSAALGKDPPNTGTCGI